MKLAEKVAVVTGGGGSIGRAVALELAKEGAAVAVADVDFEQAQAAAEAAESAGAQALAVALDVRDRQDAKRMAEAVLARFGRIDILVNAAGGSARRKSALFHESDEEVFDCVLGVNLLGVAHCIRAVIGHMVARRSGKIVNVASIVAMQGKAKHVDYAAAKGGVIAMSKSLAMEVGPFGINVNCVSPGLVPRGPVSEDFGERFTFLGKVCQPEDVARLVRFLCSDEASMITGQNYVIDGGRSLGLKGD